MEKFKIPETMGFTHRTVSVPRELTAKIDKLLSGRKTNFSDFTVAALEFALNALDEQEKEQEQN